MLQISLLAMMFSITLLLGFTPLSYSDYLSPRVQLESGVAIEDIQCKEDRMLVLRANGSPACVSERTAEKTGWEIIIKEIVNMDTLQETIVTQELITTPKVTVLDYSSPTAFVDDGREYPMATQKSAPPHDIYNLIMENLYFDVNQNGIASFNAVPHEKYSINDGVGHYVEDWLPTFVPEGQELVYGITGYRTFDANGKTYERHEAGIFFAPTTFVLTPDFTTRDMKNAKGFNISVLHSTFPLDEVEDGIEYIKDSRATQEDNYGGFRDMTRDGKTVHAFEGGNHLNPYQAIISFQPDEFTQVGVNSSYHTLDELIPIFNSVMN